MKYYTKEKVLNTGALVIPYTYIRKNVKNVNLRIKPDGTVIVSSNYSLSEEYVENYMKEKADFIVAALTKYKLSRSLRNKPFTFSDGETVELLGKELTVTVVNDKEDFISYDDKYLYIHTDAPNNSEAKQKIYNNFIMAKCKDTFTEICSEVYISFKGMGVSYPLIKIRKMSSRWGSCNPKRHILTFSTYLIQAERDCIEYVVTHEFAHFIHPNHSKYFYDVVSKIMPDWKQRKIKLEQSVIMEK